MLNEKRYDPNAKPISGDAFFESFALNEATTTKKRANVLHVLEGACMEMDAVNRNNRIYPKELIVKKILNNEATNDLMKKNCLFGEGCHPETRLETIVPNICISIEKLWIPDKEPNKLYGRFAVLDTPTGRIVSTLLEYGAKIGVSARASGTSTFTPEGYELLNIDDYEFYTFDIVTEPGFACARPNMVESKSTSILKEYKNYSSNELSSMKEVMDKYPKFFKTELSAIDNILNNNTEAKTESLKTEQVLKDNEIQCLNKTIQRLQKQNESLRNINKKKHIKEQTRIQNLTKQVEILKHHFSECTKSNKVLEQKNKTLKSLVDSQKKVLENNKKNKKKYVTEAVNKKIETINQKKLYEENVKLISKETSINEAKVKNFYKSLNDNVNDAINSIKQSKPYLYETKKPVKVMAVNESKSIQQIQQNDDELDSKLNTKEFLNSLFQT